MQCKKCGNGLAEGVKFCPNCGTLVEVAAPPPPQPVSPPNYPPTNYPPTNYPPMNYQRPQVSLQNNLPTVGAALGIGAGLLAIIGWFSPWISVLYTGVNGPQMIALPFTANSIFSFLGGFGFGDVSAGIILVAIILALISIGLATLSVLIIWSGVKCLEHRANPAALPFIKGNISKLKNYGLIGIITLVVVMILTALVGSSSIGAGVIVMLIAFVITFFAVIYLKPHLM